ncbi:MAG: hypothetical protein J6Y46_06540 [Prevotella sp.]|nr:hypothetical protein [Prevotella sp.]
MNWKRTIFPMLLAMIYSQQAIAGEPIIKNSDAKYSIQMNDLTMTIDSKGGKILSFKYKDAEVISQIRFPEAFGSTFWTSPQKEWNWPPIPEYDKQPYTVEVKGASLVMKSNVSPRLKYSITKEFVPDAKENAIIINYTITNESDETRKVAPWEVTRVQNGDGLIFFDADVNNITPAGLMDFKEEYGAAWYQPDVTNQNRKINADGKGWLAYATNGLLLVKKFQDLEPSQPAPNEAEIQVYVNRGKAHIELESQGAYTTLEPGKSLTWTVRWYLVPFDGAITPSKALLKKVKKLVK